MNRYVSTASALTAAIGMALALQAPARAADMSQNGKDKMNDMHKEHLEKCYGINAAHKNDCAVGAHSCAGQATAARDPKSYVLVPAGDCGKIAGGSLKPM